MFSKFPRYWKTVLVIVVIVVCFSLYTLFFLTYYPRIHSQSKAIIDIGDVREAQRIMDRILDKYWSKSSNIKTYAVDIYWSKKDIMIQYDKEDLNYTHSLKRFILVKIMGQIIQETELYFRWTKHPWDNVTWIQYDRINERMLIYHNGAFSGDDPSGLGSINALFYIDKYRFIIINIAPAEYCLPNFTTFKYNGTYVKLPNPCSPEDRKRLHFYYIYFRPPYIIAFTEPYDDELAPIYIANIVVITRNDTDMVLLDKIFRNYIEDLKVFESIWIKRFGEKGIDVHMPIYFDLRKIPNTPNNTRFFTEFEKNITKSLWYEVVKPVLELIHVHANSLEDIMFAIVINKHEVIYLEPITSKDKH
ncbi:MAG: hypothetical protein J7K21_04490 [Desulfurococcales archaeon]|nr:hypothetical protein [Desulfurococcales archaeon]